MSWKDALLGYRPGRELAEGEPIIQSTMARLTELPPSCYTAAQLSQLAYMPPFDERLVLTPGYLVYKTDYELLDALKKGFTTGAGKFGPCWAEPMMKTLMSCVDTEDRSFWIPRQMIRAVEPKIYQGETTSLFGSRQLTCYALEASLAEGSLEFLQTGPGERNAEKQFYRMVTSLDDLLFTDRHSA